MDISLTQNRRRKYYIGLHSGGFYNGFKRLII